LDLPFSRSTPQGCGVLRLYFLRTSFGLLKATL
jgi:hypothetical protein